MSDIIEITPVLEKTEIEYQGKKFDCRNCQGIGQCCGTVDIHNNKAACFKCKCQSLYNSTNWSPHLYFLKNYSNLSLFVKY